MKNIFLRERIGVEVEYESEEGLILGAVDYWCDNCHRQPLFLSESQRRDVCDICHKPTRLISAPKIASKILDVLFLKV